MPFHLQQLQVTPDQDLNFADRYVVAKCSHYMYHAVVLAVCFLHRLVKAGRGSLSMVYGLKKFGKQY